MESQMQRPAHQHVEHDGAGLHSGESNQPGEKKSVLKKVKEKAKKIKDTLKKPGQGQEHEYRYDENVDEEEDDDDEETAKDREIHARGSTVISSKNIPAQTGYEQENPSENKNFPSPMKPVSVHGGEESAGEPEVKLGPSMGSEEDPQSLKFQSGDVPVPHSNYESKVSDPTGDGGKEAVVGQLIHRFDHLNVGDESETKPHSEKRPFTGSHDQFNQEPNPLTTLDNPESDLKSFDSNTTEGMPRDTIAGKVSSATSALSDKAISAKNVVASKLGYGGGSGQEGLSPSNKPESAETTPGYAQRITDTLNPVYQKVAGAGTAVMYKFQGGAEAGNQGGGYGQEGISPSYKPGSESTPGYTRKITDTLNPVYQKVAGAGTAVMSKFHGGGEAGNQGGGYGQEGISPSKMPGSESTHGYTQKDYWAEKLKPGDEDKALSEAITDALHKKKEVYLQKTGEEKPIGKVTESEKVATRLGTGLEGKREGEDALDAGRQSSGPGVVGRVKDAVGSWMGKGTGTQTAQDSINETYVDNAGAQPRLQE